jgi:hypothetical protein
MGDKFRARWLLLVLLLIAVGSRFYRLDAQSFWNDEGNTARLVERPARLIVEGAAGDVHPPGYYLALAAWRAGVGETEFALRAFSALSGVLTVAVTAALGWRAGGPTTALGAASLVALHPLAVYYGQEARMYALLGLISALTLWAAEGFARAARDDAGSLRRPAAWATALAFLVVAGLYTQYAYAFVVLAINLAFAIAWLLPSRRAWARRRSVPALWGGAQLVAALAFVPWLPAVRKLSSWQPPDLDTGNAVREMARALLLGVTLPEGRGSGALVLAALLLALALAVRPRWRFALLACSLAVLLPPALIAGLGVYRPAYLKFLMVSVAPLAVLLALPLSPRPLPFVRAPRLRLFRRLGGGALLLALLPLHAASLDHLYFDPQYERDDYRGIAARIASEAGANDAVLLSAPNQWEVFTYYYDGPARVLPAPYHPTEEEAREWVEGTVLAGSPASLFVLYWGEGESDPHRRLERELAERAYKAGERWVGSVRVARYGVAPLPEEPGVDLDVGVGDSLVLEGASAPATAAPGAVLPVTLFWRAEGSPAERFKVFVHLLDEEGALVAQADAEPVGGLRPTSTWEAGEGVIDRHGVLLPPDLPPGDYVLRAGLYRFSGERLSITKGGGVAGDAVDLGRVRVE